MSLSPQLLNETLKRAMVENGGARSLGLRFYERLFEKYPSVKPLFHTPPEEQHKKLLASVGAIVASVSNTEKLLPYLRAMGIRHLKYGTENAHYGAVKENLLAVLEEHLSKEGSFSDELKESWSEALDVVNSVMVEAASNPTAYSEELAQAGYQADGFKANNPEPWLMAV